VLLSVAVCCSTMPRVAVCCSALQCVAVCCSTFLIRVCINTRGSHTQSHRSKFWFSTCEVQVLPFLSRVLCVQVNFCPMLTCLAARVCVAFALCLDLCCSVLQCVAVCFSMIQCVAVRFSVLQCVAMCCNVFA